MCWAGNPPAPIMVMPVVQNCPSCSSHLPSTCITRTPQVALEGEEVYWTDKASQLPKAVEQELQWAWDSLRTNTRCKSLVLIYQ